MKTIKLILVEFLVVFTFPVLLTVLKPIDGQNIKCHELLDVAIDNFTEKVNAVLNSKYLQQKIIAEMYTERQIIVNEMKKAIKYKFKQLDSRFNLEKLHQPRFHCHPEQFFQKLPERDTPYPRNCLEAMRENDSAGYYLIYLPRSTLKPFFVWCTKEPGEDAPYLLIQRHADAVMNFDRNWDDYKHGFGNVGSDFWLGLEKIHALTQDNWNELVIRMYANEGRTNSDLHYALYDAFAISSEALGYELSTLGNFQGTAGDSLQYSVGMKFSTKDKDNDDSTLHCSQQHGGGWWYKNCTMSNLNGPYRYKRSLPNAKKSMFWETWKGKNYPLNYIEMGIRPAARKL